MSAANGLAMLTDGKAPRNAPKTSADASVHHPTAILISENKNQVVSVESIRSSADCER